MDSKAREWAVAGLVGFDGAGVGVGCGWNADDGGEAWRQVGAEWVEDFHYEWELCQLCVGDGGDGSREGNAWGDLRVCGGEGDEGISTGAEREQAWVEGKRYVGADL